MNMFLPGETGGGGEVEVNRAVLKQTQDQKLMKGIYFFIIKMVFVLWSLN